MEVLIGIGILLYFSIGIWSGFMIMDSFSNANASAIATFTFISVYFGTGAGLTIRHENIATEKRDRAHKENVCVIKYKNPDSLQVCKESINI